MVRGPKSSDHHGMRCSLPVNPWKKIPGECDDHVGMWYGSSEMAM